MQSEIRLICESPAERSALVSLLSAAPGRTDQSRETLERCVQAAITLGVVQIRSLQEFHVVFSTVHDAWVEGKAPWLDKLFIQLVRQYRERGSTLPQF